ncbi:MAG TPA: DUF2797 domain-containing protein [Ktedonobacterales bacterium]
MANVTPPAGQPIQLTGYTWRSGALALTWRRWADLSPQPPPLKGEGEPEVRLPRTGEGLGWGLPEHWPLPTGTMLDLAARPRLGAPGVRRCVGYHPPAGGPPLPCPEWRALPPGSRSQCEACEQREGRLEIVASDGSRPPTGPRAAYLREAHEVYLAAFAPGVYKVGVAWAGRTALRVLEQGASAGLVIGRAADGMAARRLEHTLGLAGVRERIQVRTKLGLLYPLPDAAVLLAGLRAELARLVAALPDGWPDEVARLDPPRALDNTVALGLAALDMAPMAAPAPPSGALRGRMTAAAGALLVLRGAQPSLWGDAAATPEAHDLRAWLGWRLSG